jgi:ribonuclease HI
MYDMTQCEYENIRRVYKNKRIQIFSNRQAALTALSGPKVTSGVVLEFDDVVLSLTNHNQLTLILVPGHRGILVNEEADELARQGPAAPLLGSGPSLGTPWVLQEK